MQPALATITYRLMTGPNSGNLEEMKDIACDTEIHDEKTLRRHLRRFRPTAKFVD
jgi:hypothetical protein